MPDPAAYGSVAGADGASLNLERPHTCPGLRAGRIGLTNRCRGQTAVVAADDQVPLTLLAGGAAIFTGWSYPVSVMSRSMLPMVAELAFTSILAGRSVSTYTQ